MSATDISLTVSPADAPPLAAKVAACVAASHADRYSTDAEFRAAIDAAQAVATDGDVIAVLVRRLADATAATENVRAAVVAAARTGLRYCPVTGSSHD